MKNLTIFSFLFFAVSSLLHSQNYEIDEYNGQTITTCSGYFYDSGGPSGNYSNNENYTITFCSNTNEPIYVVFSDVMLESSYDLLYVYNGSTTTSPLIGTFTYNNNFTVSSSNPNNCLTFRFRSDGSTSYKGWKGTIGCGNAPIINSPSDCEGAITLICSSIFVSENETTTGYGNIQELNSSNAGCLSTFEHNSRWYKFKIKESGTLTFAINTDKDYDWALYNMTGQSCQGIINGTVPMIRCNYSGQMGPTGCNLTSTIISANSSASPWCQYVDVQAGQTWYLLIDKYLSGEGSYTLDFTYGGGTAEIGEDVITPAITSLTPNTCNGQFINLSFSTNVLIDSTLLSNAYILDSNNSVIPITGYLLINNTTNTWSFALGQPYLSTGSYSFHLSDSTIFNICNQSVNDTVIPFHYTYAPIVASSYIIDNPDNCLLSVGTATITVSGGTPPFQYFWSNGQITTNATFSNLASATYTVTIVDNFNCRDTLTFFLPNEHLPPFANVTPQQLWLCHDDTLQVELNPENNYTWTPSPTALLNSNGSSALITYNDANFFQIRMQNDFCIKDTIIAITKNIMPTVTLGSDRLVCQGEIVNIVASVNNAVNYLWSNGSTQNTIAVSPNTNTYYTVTVENSCGTATDEVRIDIIPLPVVDMPDVVEVCPGNAAILSANVQFASQFQWSTGHATTSVIVTPQQSTNFYFTATNACGHTTDSVSVIVRPFPNVVAYRDTFICKGNSAELYVTAGNYDSLLWNTGDNNPVILVTPVQTTFYSVIAYNSCGQSQSWVRVEVGDVPQSILVNDTLKVCPQTTVILQASNGEQYLWSNGSTSSWIEVAPASDTTFTVMATNVCGTSSESVFIDLDTDGAAYACPDINICPGDTAFIYAYGGSQYYWSSGDTTAAFLATPLITTTFYVSISNQCGIFSDSVTVSVANNITFVPLSDTTVCSGSSVNIISPFENADSYLWSNGSTNQTLSVIPLQTGFYTVTASNNCFSATDDIRINVLPKPTVSVGGDVTVCRGEQVRLTALGTNVNSYLWSNSYTGQVLVFYPFNDITYIVTATNDCGIAIDSVNVFVIQTPTSEFVTDTSQICFNDSIHVLYTGNALPTAFYNWTLSDGIYSGNYPYDFYLKWLYSGINSIIKPISLSVYQNNCFSSVFSTNILVKYCPSSIVDVQPLFDDLIVFPNPTQSTIKVVFPDNNTWDISIYDAVGKLVFFKPNNNHDCEINLSSFPAGEYLLQIQSKQETICRKVIVLR